MKALRLFPKMVIVVGIAFALAGLLVAGAGIYIRSFVGQQLAAQQITTPEDASIPNAPVTGMATALSMANIIQHHAAESGKGLTYAQMGRFAVESGEPAGTNNADEALKDANGKPVANQARNTQLTAAGLVTSLSLSAMAIGAAYAAIAMGVGFTVLGMRKIAVAENANGRPLGGMPMNSPPVCVPRKIMRAATLLPSAIRSSIVAWKSGKALTAI